MILSALLLAGCSKGGDAVPADSIPTRATNFINNNFPGKAIISVTKRNDSYNSTNYYGPTQSYSINIPDLSKPENAIVKVSNTNFDYMSWARANSRNISGIYTITLDGGIKLEFTLEGYFLRRL